MAERNEHQSLELNEDEAEHNRLITKYIVQHLLLTENAAVITLNCLMSLEDRLTINEPEAIVTLLMAKCANLIRFTVIGLKLGYYSGASMVLRCAFESLAYASLFHSYPNQVSIWLRNELSSRPQSDLDELRYAQMQDAKKSLLLKENDPHMIRDAMRDFWQEANRRSHASLLGLAKEFKVDIEHFVPDEIAQAEGDLDWALERYVLLSSFGKNILPKQAEADTAEEQLMEIPLTPQYDEDTLFDLSLFGFYIAHRLLDTTNVFGVKDEEFNQQYKDWHKAIQELEKPT